MISRMDGLVFGLVIKITTLVVGVQCHLQEM